MFAASGGECDPKRFKRRIKTRTVPPSAETAAMLLWALPASGPITMRKVDGWQTLAERPSDHAIDLAAGPANLAPPESTTTDSNTRSDGTE